MRSPRLYDFERLCEECGERFWGSARATCCSSRCYSRRWRARRSKASAVALIDLCGEVLRRSEQSTESWAKLLPRLFRQAAVELRRLGWDPFELLITAPDDPATDADDAPGGFSEHAPHRRRWLHPPDVEIDRLTEIIAQRRANGRSVEWHRERIATLRRIIEADL